MSDETEIARDAADQVLKWLESALPEILHDSRNG